MMMAYISILIWQHNDIKIDFSIWWSFYFLLVLRFLWLLRNFLVYDAEEWFLLVSILCFCSVKPFDNIL